MKSFIILTLMWLPTVTWAQTTLPHSFGDGESLSYAVSYRAKLIPNINVMRVVLHTISEDVGGKPHYHVVGNGKTTNFIKGFFKLNDTYHTWLDTATILPSRMINDIQEDDHRFKTIYSYDWDAMMVTVVRRNAKWDSDRYATMPLQQSSGDAISLLYRMRQIDPDALVLGNNYPLDLVMDQTTRPIYFKFIGREEIKIRKIGTFRAMKFTCTIATSDDSTYEGGMEFTMWISDDKNKIPLVIESPVRVGNIRATLTEGWKIMHPLTSLIK